MKNGEAGVCQNVSECRWFEKYFGENMKMIKDNILWCQNDENMDEQQICCPKCDVMKFVLLSFLAFC